MNTAFLIDLNTVNTEDIELIFKDAGSDGTLIIKNAYGYTNGDLNKRQIFENTGINIIETSSMYKDRTSAEIVMDIIGVTDDINIDEIYIATGDKYLVPVVRSALAKGKKITVAGASETANAYIPICSRFRFIEMLNGRKCDGPFTEISKIREAVYGMLTAGKEKGVTVDAEQIYDRLLAGFHEFDIANYGYTHFEAFVSSLIEQIVLKQENGKLTVHLADNRDDIESYMVKYLTARENKIDDMQILLDALAEEFEHFDIKNYGYTSDIAFILSFPKFEIFDNKGVKLKQTFKLK